MKWESKNWRIILKVCPTNWTSRCSCYSVKMDLFVLVAITKLAEFKLQLLWLLNHNPMPTPTFNHTASPSWWNKLKESPVVAKFWLLSSLYKTSVIKHTPMSSLYPQWHSESRNIITVKSSFAQFSYCPVWTVRHGRCSRPLCEVSE